MLNLCTKLRIVQIHPSDRIPIWRSQKRSYLRSVKPPLEKISWLLINLFQQPATTQERGSGLTSLVTANTGGGVHVVSTNSVHQTTSDQTRDLSPCLPASMGDAARPVTTTNLQQQPPSPTQQHCGTNNNCYGGGSDSTGLYDARDYGSPGGSYCGNTRGSRNHTLVWAPGVAAMSLSWSDIFFITSEVEVWSVEIVHWKDYGATLFYTRVKIHKQPISARLPEVTSSDAQWWCCCTATPCDLCGRRSPTFFFFFFLLHLFFFVLILGRRVKGT